MKKLSVLLLIMMMSVSAAVFAEEVTTTKVETTEVKSAKKIPPLYFQGGLNFGYNDNWSCGFASIPLTVGYQIKDNLAVQGTLNLYIPRKDDSVSTNVFTDKCITFDVDVIFRLNKKPDAKLDKWLSAGIGFGSTTRTWDEDDYSEKFSTFQINAGAGLEKPINDHFAVGGDAKIGFGSLFTIGLGAYAKYNF